MYVRISFLGALFLCRGFHHQLSHVSNKTGSQTKLSLRFFFGIFFRYGKHFFVKDDKHKLLCKEGGFLKLINFFVCNFYFSFCYLYFETPQKWTDEEVYIVVKTVLCLDITLSSVSFPALRPITGV